MSGGFFYSQSLFSSLSVEMPQCFADLEHHLLKDYPNAYPPDIPEVKRYVHLTWNLCRRLADVEYYASLIQDEMDRNQGPYSARIISTLLVGHFSACKAMVDASAITLVDLYSLGLKSRKRILSDKEQDFARSSKGGLWPTLRAEQPTVAKRYSKFQGTFGEIFAWRDAAVHRVHPLVVTMMGIDTESRQGTLIGFNLNPDPQGRQKPIKGKEPHDPLHFHRRWMPYLKELAEATCWDIETHSAARLVVPDVVTTVRLNAAWIDARHNEAIKLTRWDCNS